MRRKSNLLLPYLLFLAVLVACALPAAAQEWRGRGRISGIVTNPDGEPIAGCEISLRYERSGTGTTAETDGEGRWAVAGLSGGTWLIDFSHPDYQPRGISVQVSELRRMPPIELTLEPLRVVADEAEGITRAEVEAAEELFQAEQYEEAVSAFRDLAEQSPDTVAYRVRLSECLIALGNHDEALEVVDEILSGDPDNAAALAVAGNAAFTLMDYAAAEEIYLRLTQALPNDAGAWANLAETSTNLQKYDQALDAYARAIELEPEFYDLYVQLAAVKMVANDFEGALETLELLVELAPADDPIFSIWNVEELIAYCRQELGQQ